MKNNNLKMGSIWINFTVEKTIKIGSIKINLTAPCEVYKDKDLKIVASAIDGWDIRSIDYNGINIHDYKNIRKFINFHKEMGIDIHENIDKDDTLNHENITKILPKDIINLFKNLNK
jgi:hypothetical protein